jgi:hypothetical protein
VENLQGKIEFLEPVCIYGENIENEILIEERTVKVHPKGDVPPGERLNKPAIVTIKGLFEKETMILPEKILRTKAMRFVAGFDNLEFVGYDYKKNWVRFKANYF